MSLTPEQVDHLNDEVLSLLGRARALTALAISRRHVDGADLFLGRLSDSLELIKKTNRLIEAANPTEQE